MCGLWCGYAFLTPLRITTLHVFCCFGRDRIICFVENDSISTFLQVHYNVCNKWCSVLRICTLNNTKKYAGELYYIRVCYSAIVSSKPCSINKTASYLSIQEFMLYLPCALLFFQGLINIMIIMVIAACINHA